MLAANRYSHCLLLFFISLSAWVTHCSPEKKARLNRHCLLLSNFADPSYCSTCNLHGRGARLWNEISRDVLFMLVKKQARRAAEEPERPECSYLPCLDADLHLPVLKLGHRLLGHPEFVQTPETRQHHRSHFFGIAGRFHALRFSPHVPVYHALGLLRHVRSFFRHVGDLLLCRFAPARGSEWCAVQPRRCLSSQCSRGPSCPQAYSLRQVIVPNNLFFFSIPIRVTKFAHRFN